jgi:hypothetical protein
MLYFPFIKFTVLKHNKLQLSSSEHIVQTTSHHVNLYSEGLTAELIAWPSSE